MSAASVATFLDGGRVVFDLIIALSFLRLGRATHDRLYHAFAIAFVLMSVSSTLVGLGVATADWSAYAFLPRLLSFLVIIWAIVDKNRRAPTE
ncbi:MAG TPA: DUF5985 family protein [Kofleriaceae bacterium]|jgi:hypothetical protein|nr:DUF5985 family protein [Kofleriaceae bacterium]